MSAESDKNHLRSRINRWGKRCCNQYIEIFVVASVSYYKFITMISCQLMRLPYKLIIT